MTSERPHRRYNPLTDQWILVSPHRTQRPWQGQQEDSAGASRPPYDPTCYLCPGNRRANGQCNPDYSGTYVFPNDFPHCCPTRGLIDGKPKMKPTDRRHPLAKTICSVVRPCMARAEWSAFRHATT